MRLVFRSILFHFQTHWASKANFWSGVLGMIVNNMLTLLGIWAMLFAGKEALNSERDMFLLMNFLLMISYGFVHAFLGGIANLDRQINEGGLDLALTSPRHPFLMLSISSSQLPAWGDLILGMVGLLVFTLRLGPMIFIYGIVTAVFASLATFSFMLMVGSLAFWFRRTDAAFSVLMNMFLAFNTYPITNIGSGMRWTLFLVPALLAGSIPAAFVLSPNVWILTLEVLGSFIFFFVAYLFFRWGLKRYQSSSVLGMVRT